jgi:hypothetical protein
MHSTVAYTAQTPSQTARSQSARSAVCRTAVRKANREAVAVLGGKSMILVCIFTPLKIVGFIGSTPRCGRKLQKERSQGPGARRDQALDNRPPTRRRPRPRFTTREWPLREDSVCNPIRAIPSPESRGNAPVERCLASAFAKPMARRVARPIGRGRGRARPAAS